MAFILFMDIMDWCWPNFLRI